MELPVIHKLKKELQELQHELNVELPREIEAARAHGDISENAEYDAAKERQAYLRARIAQIEGRIRELSRYTLASIPEGVVAYGSEVMLEDEEGETRRFRIVFPEEVDAANGDISLSSPLGRALVGKGVGDEVEVRTPTGRKVYQIVELGTLRDLSEKPRD